jgi:hypothetical protein
MYIQFGDYLINPDEIIGISPLVKQMTGKGSIIYQEFYFFTLYCRHQSIRIESDHVQVSSMPSVRRGPLADFEKQYDDFVIIVMDWLGDRWKSPDKIVNT